MERKIQNELLAFRENLGEESAEFAEVETLWVMYHTVLDAGCVTEVQRFAQHLSKTANSVIARWSRLVLRAAKLSEEIYKS